MGEGASTKGKRKDKEEMEAERDILEGRKGGRESQGTIKPWHIWQQEQQGQLCLGLAGIWLFSDAQRTFTHVKV